MLTQLKKLINPRLKNAFPALHQVLKRIWLSFKPIPHVGGDFSLTPPISLPDQTTEESIFQFLSTVCIEGSRQEELVNYLRSDFKRFLYTYNLLIGVSGNVLELGANPYYTSMLIRQFTELDLTTANYFGSQYKEKIEQRVNYVDFCSGKPSSYLFNSYHFNIEEGSFPFENHVFDVVLCCEILEHLTMDPFHTLREIKRVLKPEGCLVLTTPNVNRLENVSRMIVGENIYDPYSAYGPYGRHNREYTVTELDNILKYLGFSIPTLFTADVHVNTALNYFDVRKIRRFLTPRQNHLGQYIFIKAQNKLPSRQKKLNFLYRSYPPAELE